MKRALWALPLLAVGLPLLAALVLALQRAGSFAPWAALMSDPLTWPALATSVRVAVAATAGSLGLALVLVTLLHGTPAWQRLQGALAPLLALPHAAFAIGLVLLWMPAGLLARLLALPLGWDAPPHWVWVQEPSGASLVITLVAKELPFLLWSMAALLGRPDLTLSLQRQLALGQSLGHQRHRVWCTVLWPQLARPLAWPVLAVAAYSLGVVDLALITGPTAPPPLAVLAWQWLSDADPARNAQGAAAAWLLAAVMLLLAALGWLLGHLGQAGVRRLAQSGRRGSQAPVQGLSLAARVLARGLPMLYGMVVALLVAVSVAGVWPFPALWPGPLDLQAWAQVAAAWPLLGLTAALGLAATLSATLLLLAWLESAPATWDRPAAALALLPVLLPPVLLLAGLGEAALRLHLDGRFAGLWWVHTLYALPYVAVALAPAWRGFDPRWQAAAQSLRPSWWRFFLCVKLPLLRAPLAASLAVGFAVSVAQYLPTQFIAAGRLATVTTEAVTLASGGQRGLGAAFALLQALLPLLGFALAWRASRLPWA